MASRRLRREPRKLFINHAARSRPRGTSLAPLAGMRVFLFRFMLWCGALAPVAVAAPPVAVIEDAPWSPDDAARDGAAELGVLLQLAQ
ncbi:MAG TPA: hypothetical protein VNR00_07060, partial [Opitutus sp.]|nr:hypothetical protein [Opitutus sp.]